MVECAAMGTGTPCAGPPARRCGQCGAVAYCSASHQMSHWKYHRQECERFQQQMMHAETLGDFPFSFTKDIVNLENRCSFLDSSGLHQAGMWKTLCRCHTVESSDDSSINDDWSLPSNACPCTAPRVPLTKGLGSWKDYYQWRCLPLESPVALLLHWPLTVYHCLKLVSGQILDLNDKLTIHYLGPEKELQQVAIFQELGALFPGDNLCIDFFGPAVPQLRDGTKIRLPNYPLCTEVGCTCKSPRIGNFMESVTKDSAVTLKFHKGFYHECHKYEKKVSDPCIIVAPNAGIAAYPSWLPTIELLNKMGVPAVFTDFCEEAANLAAKCIETVIGRPLRIPVQINPFRQPMPVEDTTFYLPCYSNCFIFGM